MNEIEQTFEEIRKLTEKLARLQKESTPVAVTNYKFRDLNGSVSLLDLFGERDVLFAVHNMGQACRYCTLWADGFNGFVPHLEDKYAVVLLSKDEPALQRRFANSRGWRFRMASHGGGEYIKEQGVGAGNRPGIVCYIRRGTEIFKKNWAQFGPGDLYCPLWPILNLAGVSDFTAQFNYWQRPGAAQMEDGGQGLL